MVNTLKELIELVAKRDGISIEEATSIVSDCQDEIWDAAAKGNFQDVEDILASYLGLEPDYLDILLPF